MADVVDPWSESGEESSLVFLRAIEIAKRIVLKTRPEIPDAVHGGALIVVRGLLHI